MLEGKTFSAPSELFLIEVEHTQDGVDTGGFTLELCSHCKVNGDSPFLFNPNLSQAPFSRDIFAPFGGNSSLTSASGDMSLPTPILSASISSMASPSSTTTITIFDLTPSTSAAAASSTGSSGGSATTTTTTKAASTGQVTAIPGFVGPQGQLNVPRTVTARADAPLAANPEPASMLLLGTGLAAGVIGRRTLRGRRV